MVQNVIINTKSQIDPKTLVPRGGQGSGSVQKQVEMASLPHPELIPGGMAFLFSIASF